MAGVSLLALLDDIAALMDDVSVLTKVAARKAAGVLGDDLAVNAEKVTGVPADRELPVVYAVFKGSLLNKCMLVPGALLISAVAPWLITPLLIAGGVFLCYEGFEKVWHSLRHSREEKIEAVQPLKAQLEDPAIDPVQLEQQKIKGAIRTDFILSAEIIVITLGVAGDATLAVRAAVLTVIALAMTVGVYGLVAGIVKIDDLGLNLVKQELDDPSDRFQGALGRFLLAVAPRFMRLLTIVGTLAMFLVGGGIVVHGVHLVYEWSEMLLHALRVPNGWVYSLAEQVYAGLLGVLIGAIAVVLFNPLRSLFNKSGAH
ncbi:MAG: DUF808 domain-containing protein [Pseudomonadota bacterium]